MALFIRRFSKMMSKQKFFKRDKNRFRIRTKRVYHNCGKYGHYIANCPYEHREEDDDIRRRRRRKATRKTSIIRRKPIVGSRIPTRGGE